MKTLWLALCGALWAVSACAAPKLILDSVIVLQMADPRFGGFSSLEVAADGMSFIATSDRGALLQGDILREKGRMVGVANLRLRDITDRHGHPLTGYQTDAEGLAVSATGEVYMSFEGNHRVMMQRNMDARPVQVNPHPDFQTLIPNSGLEALATDGAGGLYAIPERSGGETRPFPVYHFAGGTWTRAWAIPRSDGFLVSGADFFAGKLYVLERRFGSIWGFATRVRRFAPGDSHGEVLLETAPGSLDNMEGIALWQPEGGAPRVMLIADDNFMFLQKNQLAEFVLQP
jgi:hypothetical protein